MNRLHNLDYLRGMAAFGIMIYHYLTWTYGHFSAETFLGRVGVYGVSIFYVLSGLTLYLVYQDKMKINKLNITNFFIKRIFRIFLLMWLAIFVSITLSGQKTNLYDLFLNLTGLFGFLNWDKYFSIGLWSIGNELVFYTFFIVFMILIQFQKKLFYVLTLVIFLIFIYFSFFIFSENNHTTYTLSSMWRYYSNPLNQVFLFLGGFLIGFFFVDKQINKNWGSITLTIGFIIFCLYPVSGNTVFLVTGVSRIVFTMSCFLICFGFYKTNFNFKPTIHLPLSILGEISYSMYLIHPLIIIFVRTLIFFLNSHFFKVPFITSVVLLTSIISTIFLSYFMYQYFEKYFIKLGNSKFSLK